MPPDTLVKMIHYQPSNRDLMKIIYTSLYWRQTENVDGTAPILQKQSWQVGVSRTLNRACVMLKSTIIAPTVAQMILLIYTVAF